MHHLCPPYLCDPSKVQKGYNSPRSPPMPAPDLDPQNIRSHWQQAGSGAHYAGGRWRNARAAGRDPRRVARALARHAPNLSGQLVLDAPSGAGRLREALEGRGARYVGLDASPFMLAEGSGGGFVQGSAWALPFPSRTFGAVVCCRLLHHVADEDSRAALIGELLRVSAGPVLLSFWDSTSWHAWRRRKGMRHAHHPDSRTALHRGELERLVRAAGAEPLEYFSSLRFVSQQTFLIFRATPSGPG